MVALVKDLLRSPCHNIEVVVLDNQSTDATESLLAAITDSRFRFLQNEVNIGGIRNCLQVLLEGTGTFVLLCLDKDQLNIEFLDGLVAELSRADQVGAGFCELSVSSPGKPKHYTRGFEALSSLGYLCKHPSGYFFRKESIRGLKIVERFSNMNDCLGFPVEFVFGEVCAQAGGLVIQLPIMRTETLAEARDYKSHTYSANDGSAYFLPGKRFILLHKFLTHLATLPLSTAEMHKLASRLFRQQLESATSLYRYICAEPSLCSHHGMAARRVGAFENGINFTVFCSRFLWTGGHPPFVRRSEILLGYLYRMVVDRTREVFKSSMRHVLTRCKKVLKCS